MNRAKIGWLCGCLIALPIEAFAGKERVSVDSRQLEAGVYRVQRFDRDFDNTAPDVGAPVSAADTHIFVYGRTDATSVFEHGEDSSGKIGGKLTFELEAGVDWGVDDDADSLVWGGGRLYLPIVLDKKHIDNKGKGIFDPDLLPHLTGGIASNVSSIKGGNDSDNRNEWTLNPFLLLHGWFDIDGGQGSNGVQSDRYSDITFELGADFVESDESEYDRWDWYGAMEARYRQNSKIEWSLRSQYVDTDFDESGVDDEKVWAAEVNVSYLAWPVKDNGGIYLDLALGYEDIDADSYDGSFFYATPSIYWRYATGSRSGVGPFVNRTSRSSRRGIWFR